MRFARAKTHFMESLNYSDFISECSKLEELINVEFKRIMSKYMGSNEHPLFIMDVMQNPSGYENLHRYIDSKIVVGTMDISLLHKG